MIIDRMKLWNFRNYEIQELKFNPKFNFIYGNNGQGKTNMLEAVSLLTYGKSFLGSAEADCVRIGSNGFRIDCEFENDIGGRETLAITYETGQRGKTVFRNRERIGSFSSEIFGRYPVVFLSPANLEITYGTPAHRRKYFDIVISQASPVYLECLKNVARLLKQKNALLRDISQHGRSAGRDAAGLLRTYNERLSVLCAELVSRRLGFISEFGVFFRNSFSFLITGEQESFIEYESDAFGSEMPADELQEEYLKHFESNANDECSRGITLCGPQRDDYSFSMRKGSDRFGLRNFASQGEHKTFLVALKLAEYEYLKSEKATAPVLLLDDILSELDHTRVAQIVSHLKDYGQIFLTTADHTHLEKMRKFYSAAEIAEFKVTEGKAIHEAQSN